MQRCDEDHQEDDLEEGDEDVGGGDEEGNHAQHRGHCSLHDGQTQGVQTLLHTLFRRVHLNKYTKVISNDLIIPSPQPPQTSLMSDVCKYLCCNVCV